MLKKKTIIIQKKKLFIVILSMKKVLKPKKNKGVISKLIKYVKKMQTKVFNYSLKTLK